MQVARQTAPPARCCPSQQRRRKHKRAILECSGKLQQPCRSTSERVYNAFISGALTGRDTLGPLPVWRPPGGSSIRKQPYEREVVKPPNDPNQAADRTSSERYPAISVAIAAYSTPALRAATRTTLDQS